MALMVTSLKEASAMPKVTVDRRLYLNADKNRLLEDGDPAVAFLWADAGKEVDAAEAEALGYAPKSPASEDEPKDAPEEKAVEAPPNKQRRSRSNKKA